jgi:hypothetical protein
MKISVEHGSIRGTTPPGATHYWLEAIGRHGSDIVGVFHSLAEALAAARPWVVAGVQVVVAEVAR